MSVIAQVVDIGQRRGKSSGARPYAVATVYRPGGFAIYRFPQVAGSFPEGLSSAGRAPALQAGSQGFESPRLHPTSKATSRYQDGVLSIVYSSEIQQPLSRRSASIVIM